MADLLRRILWLVPVLIAGAFVVFFAFANLRSVQEDLERPLFYNPSPLNSRLAARQALEWTRSGDPRGAASLERLGGAALPYVLEELPGLPVSEQRAVGHGLQAVAQRMQLKDRSDWSKRLSPGSTSEESGKADAALLFWERYRDEHALDLRPLATSRLVKRSAQRDSAFQNADLLAVDTYALPALVQNIGRVRQQEDVARVRRLAKIISHVLQRDFTIPEQASIVDARRAATEIRRYWDDHGAQFTPLDRFELLVARFSQTEFASWVFRTIRQMTGLDHPVLLERIATGGQKSGALLIFCLFGLLFLGPTVTAMIQVALLRTSLWQLERWGLRAGLAGGLVALIPLLVAPGSASWTKLVFSCVVMGTLFSVFMLQRELNDRLDWRTHHVLRMRPGLGKVAAIVRWLAPSVPTLTPIAVAEAAVWVTCLEVSSGTAGLGSTALRSIRSGDLDFLMAFCLGLGLLTGLCQIFADLLLGSLRSSRGEI